MLAAVAAGTAALIILLIATGLRIEMNAAVLGFLAGALVLAGLRYTFRRAGPRPNAVVSDCAEDTGLFIFIGLLGAIGSYGVAALTHGWVDAAMVRVDSAIGFNWNAWYALTLEHEWIQVVGKTAYSSIFASPAVIILSFALHKQRDEARQFLAYFVVAATISLVSFKWLPTLGPLAYMWHEPIGYMPFSGVYQAYLIPALREGHAAPIDIGHLRGLVGPPSFHAASAVLFVLAAWRTRNLGWPVTVLNFIMLLSIPVEGTHYAIDVITGSLVALFSFALVRMVAKQRGAA